MKRITITLACLFGIVHSGISQANEAPQWENESLLTCRSGWYVDALKLTNSAAANQGLYDEWLEALTDPDGVYYGLGIQIADFTATPTWAYNCHGYAWPMMGNANATPYWIGLVNGNLDKYWDYTNGCYIEINEESEADAIFYRSEDRPDLEHSARLAGGNSGKYISKWGAGPVVTHDPTTVPGYDTSDMVYYKSVYNMNIVDHSITRTINAGSSATFQLNATPADNIQWLLYTNYNLTGSGTVPGYTVSQSNNVATVTVSSSLPATTTVYLTAKLNGWFTISPQIIQAVSGSTNPPPAIDFRIVNQSPHTLTGIWVGLNGSVGGSATNMFGYDVSSVGAGQTFNGYPNYPGNSISAAAGTTISNLNLQFYAQASGYPRLNVIASIDGGAQAYTNSYYAGNTLNLPVPDTTVPTSGRRLISIWIGAYGTLKIINSDGTATLIEEETTSE